MRSWIFFAAVCAIVAKVRAAPSSHTRECVLKKIEESTELVRVSMLSNVDDLIHAPRAKPQMKSFAVAVREMVEDIAVASREMLKSEKVEDLAVNKANAGLVLDSRSREWTTKIFESFETSPDTIETRKAKAASVYAIFIEVGYQTFLAIEDEAAKDCF